MINLIKYSNIIILGSGPSGYTNAIYLHRSNLNPLLITGNQIGGLLINSNLIENWPTIINIKGKELMNKFFLQIKNFNIELSYDKIYKINCFYKSIFMISINKSYYLSNSLIISTGSFYNSVKNINNNFINISFCGLCDGNFYKNKNIIILGGGTSSIYNSIILSEIVNKITLIHRKNYFNCDYLQIIKLFKLSKNLNCKLNSIIIEFISNKFLIKYIKVKNLINFNSIIIYFSGVFFFIGNKINSDFLLGQLKTINKYIKIEYKDNYNYSLTNINGIFSSGDVNDYLYKQAIISSGIGAISSIDSFNYILNY